MQTNTITAMNGSPAAARSLSKLREVTGTVVGTIFYGAMLKSIRESSMRGTIGHGGRGEEVFGAQLDQVLAERMGEADQKRGIAADLYRRLEAQQLRMVGGKQRMGEL